MTGYANEEYIVGAAGFIAEYIDEGYPLDSDVKELHKLSLKLASKYKSAVPDLLESLYTKLSDLTKGENVEANTLGLGINLLMLALENGAFKGSTEMKVKRLVNSIYAKIEFLDNVPNTNKLIGELDDYVKGY